MTETDTENLNYLQFGPLQKKFSILSWSILMIVSLYRLYAIENMSKVFFKVF